MNTQKSRSICPGFSFISNGLDAKLGNQIQPTISVPENQ